MSKLPLATLTLAFFAPATVAAQPLSSDQWGDQWQVHSQNDDFTDKVDTVATMIKSEDGDAVLSISCSPQEQVLMAKLLFAKYLGNDDTEVRWRIGKQKAHTEEWQLNKVVAQIFLYAPQFAEFIIETSALDSTTPTIRQLVQQNLIYELLSAPKDADSMIYEVTDDDGDKHRGKVTLSGSKVALREVLESCPEWDSLSRNSRR